MGNDIPVGRFSRFTRLAAAGARMGASMLGKDATDSAAAVAASLGHLRGIAAKLGQMASYIDGVVPEAQREVYEKAMVGLQRAAPRSDFADIRAAVESSLGAPLADLFARFDEVPIASASIGQVHRAALSDGREVAVKVQHPGIVRAMKSDLANADMLEVFLRPMGGSRLKIKDQIAILRERFLEELDYDLEAERLRAFAQIHLDDPKIRIPEVIADRSSKTVLTTTFEAGIHFDEAVLAPVESRVAWAETLWRFVFRGILCGGLFNADPHPGNYLFRDDGVVVFLDFGCVQPIDDHHRLLAREIHLAAAVGDRARFGRAAASLVDLPPGPMGDAAIEYSLHAFKPIFESPWHMERPYVASLVEGLKSIAQMSRDVERDQVATMPPHMLFMNRLQFGFYSVLARLDVSVDYAEVERAFLGEDLAVASEEPPSGGASQM